MYLQGNTEYISSNAYALSYMHACMITLTLKSYSRQLVFNPDSIVSSLILQSNIINLLYLYSFNLPLEKKDRKKGEKLVYSHILIDVPIYQILTRRRGNATGAPPLPPLDS